MMMIESVFVSCWIRRLIALKKALFWVVEGEEEEEEEGEGRFLRQIPIE